MHRACGVPDRDGSCCGEKLGDGEAALASASGDGSQKDVLQTIRSSAQARHETATAMLLPAERRWGALTPEAGVGGYFALAHRMPLAPSELVASALCTLLYGWMVHQGLWKNGAKHCRPRCGGDNCDDKAHSLPCSVFVAWLCRLIPIVHIPAQGATIALLRAVGMSGRVGRCARNRGSAPIAQSKELS